MSQPNIAVLVRRYALQRDQHRARTLAIECIHSCAESIADLATAKTLGEIGSATKRYAASMLGMGIASAQDGWYAWRLRRLST